VGRTSDWFGVPFGCAKTSVMIDQTFTRRASRVTACLSW